MKQRKRFAIFGSNLTSRYKRSISRVFNIAAEELDVDLVIFNTYGRIGTRNGFTEDYETEILDYFDLDRFDGIVFDGEGYNVDGMSESIERKLRSVKCPVISISSHINGFYNIEFDDAGGQRRMVEHFLDDHHFTRIAYMAGRLDHPDAKLRLKEFRAVMKEHGLPEDGVGVFEGDFWYKKGVEAAHYFMSLSERPEAIVCANDYMAMSLINALRSMGVGVPEDIAVAGYDGTYEGQEFLPRLTSVTRERMDIARRALKLLVDLADGKGAEGVDLRVTPKPVLAQSCGCEPLEYRHILEIVDRMHVETRRMGTDLYESESAMVKLNKVDSVRKMEAVFEEDSVNFGDYSAFFMMVHKDAMGIPAYDSSFTYPSGTFAPVIWIDKNKEYTKSPHSFGFSNFIPTAGSDRCHVYYVMSVHCAEKLFGYSVVEMTGKEIFTEYHNMWLHNLGLTLNALQKDDQINKLIRKLEGLSITDDLTSMLNRRGFDDKSRAAISAFRGEMTVCAMVIDMDGLKRINDEFGHYEGDRAIRALAEIISRCCDSGEIAGRAGGDEFYIFAPDYSETRLKRFIERMKEYADEYNRNNDRGYVLDFSYGAYLTETDSYGRLEEFLKVSDARMYEQKMTKPGRRRE
ncbi:MAG: GGDEF domain-containing protein [Lachnospiraceae bacterium]|nr:GGDEF domain-containing protein [Lachnospiraceae bacterium]